MASSHRRRLNVARLVLGALFIVVLVVVSGVLVENWRSAERSRVLRHQLVAERLFDGMERELNALLAREDARAFVDYRPSDGLIGERPDYAIGWFQVDPEGRFAVAHAVDPEVQARLQAAASPLGGWGVEPLEAGDRSHTATVSVQVPVSVPSSLGKPPKPVATQTRPTQQAPPSILAKTENPNADNMPLDLLPIDNNFNNAVSQRASRDPIQRVQISTKQLTEFTLANAEEPPTPEPEEAPIQAVAPPQAAPVQRVWVPVEVEVPQAETVELVDVLVGAMTLDPGVDPDTLLLHRVVRLDRRAWVQGLLLDVSALRAELVSRSLEGTGLAPAIDVQWGQVPAPPPGHLLFEHRFASPFDAFVANAVIAPLPAPEAQLDLALWITCAVMLAMAAVGLVAVHHMLVLTTRQAQEREDFVSAVTHELKSPLTSIRMYSEMLETGVVGDVDGQHAYHRTIRTEAERLTRLVDDVLVFSRMERGLPIAGGSTGTLDVVVREIVRMYAPQAEAAGATLDVAIAESCVDTEVDRDALSQVLTNLLDNAVKFSANAGDRRVHVQVDVRDGRAHLRVRDHGPGVPRALLRRMFEPFVRGERELTRSTKGTGIGLALVQRLAQHMGGGVHAQNHPDGGLEVAVWLPAA